MKIKSIEAFAITNPIAGGTYEETFKKVYAGTAPSGTPVYIYVPDAYTLGQSPAGVRSMDPLKDWNTADDFTPCAEKSPADYVITQARAAGYHIKATAYSNKVLQIVGE